MTESELELIMIRFSRSDENESFSFASNFHNRVIVISCIKSVSTNMLNYSPEIAWRYTAFWGNHMGIISDFTPLIVRYEKNPDEKIAFDMARNVLKSFLSDPHYPYHLTLI